MYAGSTQGHTQSQGMADDDHPELRGYIAQLRDVCRRKQAAAATRVAFKHDRAARAEARSRKCGLLVVYHFAEGHLGVCHKDHSPVLGGTCSVLEDNYTTASTPDGDRFYDLEAVTAASTRVNAEIISSDEDARDLQHDHTAHAAARGAITIDGMRAIASAQEYILNAPDGAIPVELIHEAAAFVRIFTSRRVVE